MPDRARRLADTRVRVAVTALTPLGRVVPLVPLVACLLVPRTALAQSAGDPGREYVVPDGSTPPPAPLPPSTPAPSGIDSGAAIAPPGPAPTSTQAPTPAGASGGAYGFDQHPVVRVRGKRSGVTWEANVDGRVSYIDRIPELRISQDVAGAHGLSSGTHVQGNTSLVTAGVGFDFGLVINDRWRIGGIGGSYESSVGSSARQRAYVDGSIAELRPWTASRFGFDFGGVGQRFKYRRWQFGWLVSGSVIVTTMNLSVANGAGSADAWGASAALSVHGQVEACRRLDLESRVCLAVAPDVFDGGYVMRGGSLFARWEWGR